MQQSIEGFTETASASRYLQQLCKHWSHKARDGLRREHGTIRFDAGDTVVMSATADRLLVEVQSETAEKAANFRDVVEKHIARFAFRETLSFQWGDSRLAA